MSDLSSANLSWKWSSQTATIVMWLHAEFCLNQSESISEWIQTNSDFSLFLCTNLNNSAWIQINSERVSQVSEWLNSSEKIQTRLRTSEFFWIHSDWFQKDSAWFEQPVFWIQKDSDLKICTQTDSEAFRKSSQTATIVMWLHAEFCLNHSESISEWSQTNSDFSLFLCTNLNNSAWIQINSERVSQASEWLNSSEKIQTRLRTSEFFWIHSDWFQKDSAWFEQPVFWIQKDSDLKICTQTDSEAFRKSQHDSAWIQKFLFMRVDQNQMAEFIETWYTILGTQVLPSLFKWWL